MTLDKTYIKIKAVICTAPQSERGTENAAREGEYPMETKNSEYEKPRTVCDSNARGLIRSVNFWVPRSA